LNWARFKRVDTNETGTSTTHYVAGGTYEVVTDGTNVTRKLTIAGGAATSRCLSGEEEVCMTNLW
jgi:hypothetical protein